MRLSFINVTIHDFMSLHNVSLDLKNAGFTLVKGTNTNTADSAYSNGSGKSSLFEAIIWCLTGETLRGTKDVVNKNSKDGTYVTVEFTFDNSHFCIRRSKDHVEYKTNLYIEKDFTDISGKGIRDTEKIFKDILPDITVNFLGSVILLGQGLPVRFTQNSPSGRKDVLEQLSKSDFMIEDLKSRVSKRETFLKSSLRQLENELLVLESTIKLSVQQKQDAEQKLSTLVDASKLTEQVDSIVQELASLKLSTTTDKNSTEDTRVQLLQHKVDLQNQLLQVKQEIDSRFSQSTYSVTQEIQHLQTRATILKDTIYKVESIQDVCPTCGRKLDDVHKPCIDTERQEYSSVTEALSRKLKEKEQLDKDRCKAQQQAEEDTRKTILTIDEKLSQLKQQEDAKVAQEKQIQNRITYLTNSKDSLEKQIAESEFIRKTLTDTIITCEEAITKFSEEISVKESLRQNMQDRLTIQNKFSTYLKRDFRGYLLTNVIDYLNNRVKDYSKDVFDSEVVEFILSGNNILIKYAGRDYENLSGGERQKVDLIVQFSIRDMLSSYRGFSSSILVMDEIFDNIDSTGCSKIIDLISKRFNDVESIYIISHHAEVLNIPVDSTIHIVKDSSGNSTLTL